MIEPKVLTFGCRLNAAESEQMLAHATSAGLKDIAFINTCAVTAEAERQAGQSIRRLRRTRPEVKIVVTGCAAHIDANKFKQMAEVDEVIDNIQKLDAQYYKKLSPQPDNVRLELPKSGQRRDGDIQRAFVQVQNGCDHRCTFCIIPFGRGASRSLAVKDVIRETARKLEQGYQEIVFTGVDITSYGKESGLEMTLGGLIGEVLEALPSLPRLRLSSLDPAEIDEDLWTLIANEPRLMPHLHLSVQAGDDMVLKRMKRRHLRADVIRLCERARRLRPDIAFGADIIVGFPTETEIMFQNTCSLLRECAIEWLHVFPYSKRSGTPAARMPEVAFPLKRDRAERLRALGETLAAAHLERLAGVETDVLVEQRGLGCTPQFAKIDLEGEAMLGTITKVVCYVDEQQKIKARPVSIAV